MSNHALSDHTGNGILYGTHLYPWKKDWDAHVTPAIAKVAVFVGEVGTKPWKVGDPPHENVYTPDWAPQVIAYINKHELSWTAWSFHPAASPCLISGWDYKPTGYWGIYIKAALAGKPLAPPADSRTSTELSGEMLVNGSFASGASKWVVEEAGATGKAEVVEEGPDDKAALRLKVLTVGDQPWRLQVYQPGLRIEKGKKYTLAFWAKSDHAAVITVNCMQNHAPWEHHGAVVDLGVTTEWKQMSFTFNGPWEDANARITFTNLGVKPGQVYWFAKCSMAPCVEARKVAAPAAPSQGPVTALNQPVGSYSFPVAAHGALQVVGSHVCDASGKPYQLKGMSLFWSQWSGPFYTRETINALAKDWRCTVVRIAMGAEAGKGGYLENPADALAKVRTVVDAAIAKGIYVIIDWHEEPAPYGTYPNLIFEIYNEPNGPEWPVIKGYAETVIGAIRKSGSTNLVVVGTPRWSQDVDIAALDPITDYKNIAYSLHFYAGSHRQFLRDKATQAMSKGIALFVTEWGTCDSSGNGGLDLTESDIWLRFLHLNSISWANFSLNDKAETTSTLKPGTLVKGRPSVSDLTPPGVFVFNHLVAP